MTQNRLLYLIQTILVQCWQFLRLPFPGTNVSIGALLALPVIVGFAMRFIKNITGVGGVGGATNTISSIRSRKD